MNIKIFFSYIFQTDAASTCDVSTVTDDGTWGDNSHDVSRDNNQVSKKIQNKLYYNAPVICNHCPTSYRDGRGIAGLMCEVVTFLAPLQCRESAGLVILCRYTPVEFTVIKSRAMTLSRSLQCKSYSRDVMDEKSSSPLFPVGGGGGGGMRCSGYK